MKLEWPFIETRTHWIAVGVNEDLNVAMVNATREAVNWLANQKMVPMSRYEAYSLVSMAADCRVSQVVDIRKGVHCMIPKSIFTKRSVSVVVSAPNPGPLPPSHGARGGSFLMRLRTLAVAARDRSAASVCGRSAEAARRHHVG